MRERVAAWNGVLEAERHKDQSSAHGIAKMEDEATDVSVIFIFALISIFLVLRHFFNQTEFETATLQENSIMHRIKKMSST